MTQETNKEFLLALADLLEKYDMTISYTCGAGSDTHGIYDEQLIIYNGKNETIFETDYDTYLDANNTRKGIK